MKVENTISEEGLAQGKSKGGLIAKWKNITSAYQLKKYNDQSFRATVIALQVFGVTIIVFGLVFILIQKSKTGLPAQGAKANLGFLQR